MADMLGGRGGHEKTKTNKKQHQNKDTKTMGHGFKITVINNSVLKNIYRLHCVLIGVGMSQKSHH